MAGIVMPGPAWAYRFGRWMEGPGGSVVATVVVTSEEVGAGVVTVGEVRLG
jgi:hypothetical protein